MRTNTMPEGIYAKWKSRLNLTFLVGALLFISCSGNEDTPDPDNGEKPAQDFPVRFSPGLSGWATRATDGSWDADDKIGIYMVPHTAEASATADFSRYTGAVNTPYVTSGSGTSVSLAVVSGNNAIFYPTDGGKVNFVAYYPYRGDVHTTGGNVYKVDVSNQSPSKAIDLLYHKGTGTAYDKNSGSATLAFTHQLSKMKTGLVPGSGVEADLTGATVTLSGFPTTADFALSTGVLSNLGGATKAFTPVKDAASSGTQATFEAIVVPHSGSAYTRNVTFRINGENYNYAFPASGAFKAGVIHNYAFRFTGAKVEPAQVTVPYGDGGTVSWGDYQLTTSRFAFELTAVRTSENTVTLSTNAPSALVYTLSEDANSNTTGLPEWITDISLSKGAPDGNGWSNYTLTFGTNYNINAAPRTGYIRLETDGLSLPVRVTQAAGAGLYVREPIPASFPDLAVTGKTGNTFTIQTNAPDEDITVTATNTGLITNLTKSRSEVGADGSSTWTIGFDVTANTTTTVRAGQIEVTIGGIKKTVNVSQAAVSVNNPIPASFPDLAVTGKTGNTFTIQTNAPDEDITVTATNTGLITNLTKSRSEVGADGSSTWTIGFDVTANPTTTARAGQIEVTIGGIKKTIPVSQVGVYIYSPVPASFNNLAVTGATGYTFTLTTNARDEDITVTTTNADMITKLTKSRSAVGADGSSTWTIGFDVPANPTTSARAGQIEVTIGGVKKTVNVSQAGMSVYVNEPEPASFNNIIVAGKTGNTFTVQTNAPDETITVTTTNTTMITNLKPLRATLDTSFGTSYLWTVTFDVPANPATSARNGNIEVIVGGVKKTVNVTQVALYAGEPSPASFSNVIAAGLTGGAFTITTNVPDETVTVTTTNTDVITNLTPSRSAVGADGSSTWTIGFDVPANTTTSVRSGKIEVTIGSLKRTVNVTQAGMSVYVNEPDPASFNNIIVAGKTGNTFTLQTNAPDETIAATTTNTTMITNLTPLRSAVAQDGSSTWTIGFDVTANTTTSVRSGNIEVTIGSIKKTVNVSQVALSVSEPSPSSFSNLTSDGVTGNTFTLTTNAPDETITVTATNTDMITNLKPSRGTAGNGSFTWTISFDVTANETGLVRSDQIEVTISGVKKTVNVSQLAVTVLAPVPSSFSGVLVAGKPNYSFTVTTNSTATEPASLTTTDDAMITNLNASRSAQAKDGTYVWTVTFDVSQNTTTSDRTATIAITIGGITKTVNVSQVALYVNTPVPDSFTDLAVGGATGNRFTVATNAPDEDITVVATNPAMITALNRSRSAVAADGSSTWTIGFEATPSTAASARSSAIEVTISGVTRRVNVSQAAGPWTLPTTTADGLTNCYMVTPGSSITFPITRAITIGNMPNSPDVKVEVLWSDTNVISGAPTLLGYSTERTITVTTTSTQGNAVIALKVGTSTRWSWHIWVTDYPEKGATYTGTNNVVFMDRNLGATFAGRGSGAGTGLFYSYGNRTPNSYTYSTISISDAYNMYKEKSIHDPCPEGWRMPRLNAFSTLTHETIIGTFIEGFTWDKYAEFPAAGALDVEIDFMYNPRVSGYYLTADVSYNGYGWIPKVWHITYGSVNNNGETQGVGLQRGISVRCIRE